jgi:glycine/D-amino acid oxidase-like deaminating enzyme
MTTGSDVVVIGGGLVASALAYGLTREGCSVTVLDEGDVAYRASRGNFGLVWVQSKGDGLPEYARWTRLSADLWPGFSNDLLAETGVDTNYHKPGGVHLCLSDEAMESHAALIHRMHAVHGAATYGARLLDRQEVAALLPGLGPDVVGGSWSPHDGHVSPLYLLRALHAGLQARGGEYRPNSRVTAIHPRPTGFQVDTDRGAVTGEKVVLAAGLGNRALGPMVDLHIPVWPLKGQILVTERTTPRLSMPTTFVRQTEEGSFLLGDSHEPVGFDTVSRAGIMADIAGRAIRTFPYLKDLRVVRSWAALRVMTDDGFPIYDQSRTHPGAFTVNGHSGVTLAGAHALALAPMIARGRFDEEISMFSVRRFHVQAH